MAFLNFQLYQNNKRQFFFLFVECLDLVSKLLDNNPNLRPSIDDVLNHPWMKSESDKAVNESKENEKLAMIKILVEKVDKLNEEKKQVNEAVAKAKNRNMNLKAKLGIAPKVKSQKNHIILYSIMWPEPLTASQYSKETFYSFGRDMKITHRLHPASIYTIFYLYYSIISLSFLG